MGRRETESGLRAESGIAAEWGTHRGGMPEGSREPHQGRFLLTRVGCP